MAKHYITEPFLLKPSVRHPGEDTLECPRCHSQDVMMTVEFTGRGTGPMGRSRMGDPCWSIDACGGCGATRRRLPGERLYAYRGVTFTVAPDAGSPSSGLRWRIPVHGLYGDFAHWEESPGMFYDGEPDHPEGAYEWARAAACVKIDKVLDASGGR